jgi:glutathione S-transferase
LPAAVGAARLPGVIRVHRIPFSTNVERVALAAGIKGVEVDWVDHDPADRAALVELSGQPLVPVAEIEGEVVSDSMAILERLESHAPEPALYPANEASAAIAAVFVDWFNGVWKLPPNELENERAKRVPDPARIDALIAQAHALTPRFEAMLSAHPFLLGHEVGVADVCTFPFLKYAEIDTAPGDPEPFHPALEDCLRPADGYPRLGDWVRRVDALPRA